MTSMAVARPRAAASLHWEWLGTVPYLEAWERQRHLAAARATGRLDSDVLLLLEHPPVYTLGRNCQPAHLRRGRDHLRGLGAEVHEVDRGGSVTFHGPGQLVAYPIVHLAGAFPVLGHPGQGDVGRYLRALEAALCATCAAVGIAAEPSPPYTGAWVRGAKVAAIGVKLSGGVTQHGVALNICPDLRWFDHVVPCGIEDRGVTSLARHGVAAHSPQSLAPVLAREIASELGARAVPGLPAAR